MAVTKTLFLVPGRQAARAPYASKFSGKYTHRLIEGSGGSLLFELSGPADLRAGYGADQTLANIARLETNERAAQADGVSVPTIEKRISSVIRKQRGSGGCW